MFQVSSCEATFQDNVAPTDTIIISSNQTKKDLNLETFLHPIQKQTTNPS